MAKHEPGRSAPLAPHPNPRRREGLAFEGERSSAITVGRNLWRTAVRFVPALLPIIFISRLLEQYSGTALWLPHAFRELVLLVSSILGTMIFAYYRPGGTEAEHDGRVIAQPTSNTAAIPTAVSSAAGQEPTSAVQVDYAGREMPNRKQISPKQQELLAIRMMLLCIVFLGCFVALRQNCVLVGWNADKWIDSEREDPNDNAKLRPLREVLLNLPTFVNIMPEVPDAIRNAPFWKRWWRAATGTGPSDEPEHVASAEILLPLWYPAAQKAQIQRWDRDPQLPHGITGMLAENPNLVMNWESNAFSVPLGLAILLFFILHFAIIYCFSAAVGSAYRHVEAGLYMIRII